MMSNSQSIRASPAWSWTSRIWIILQNREVMVDINPHQKHTWLSTSSIMKHCNTSFSRKPQGNTNINTHKLSHLYHASFTYFEICSVQPDAAFVVCRMFMFRGIYSQFPPFSPQRTRTHFRSFSFTFIYNPRPLSDKAKRVFQNDYKARQVSKMDAFSLCVVHVLIFDTYLYQYTFIGHMHTFKS